MTATIDLAHIPIVDHHCHSLNRHTADLTAARWHGFFTESSDPAVIADHTPTSIFYRWATRELADYFGCAPTTRSVLAARQAIPPATLATDLIRDANIDTMLVDVGLNPGAECSIPELRERVPARVHPIRRLELLAQDLIVRGGSFDAVADEFVATLERARASGYIAFKSIAAYRTGLAIGDPSHAEARAAFNPVAEAARRDGRLRLATKPLNDYFVRLALSVAARLELPVQFHAGFGDADLDLLQSNPLLLRPILHDSRYRAVPLVILHAGYPYARELGYLTSLHPNVFADLSLAIPFVAAEIPDVIHQILALAPTSKVLFATDAFSIPELFWLAARWGRRALARYLANLIADDVLDADSAPEIATAILSTNARRLYNLT